MENDPSVQPPQTLPTKLFQSFLFQRVKLIIVIFLTAVIASSVTYLILNSSGTKQESPQQISSVTKPPATTPDQTTNWKSYTTDKNMDINDILFKNHPDIKRVSQLTFQYPSTWYVYPIKYAYMIADNNVIQPSFELRKTHPKNNSVHQQEGLLYDNVSFSFYFGLTPLQVKDFDEEFWGMGHILDKTVERRINNTNISLGYYAKDGPYPIQALFHLSPTTQLYVKIGYENTDPSCQTAYCQKTSHEISKILSTFKFSQ